MNSPFLMIITLKYTFQERMMQRAKYNINEILFWSPTDLVSFLLQDHFDALSCMELYSICFSKFIYFYRKIDFFPSPLRMNFGTKKRNWFNHLNIFQVIKYVKNNLNFEHVYIKFYMIFFMWKVRGLRNLEFLNLYKSSYVTRKRYEFYIDENCYFQPYVHTYIFFIFSQFYIFPLLPFSFSVFILNDNNFLTTIFLYI